MANIFFPEFLFALTYGIMNWLKNMCNMQELQKTKSFKTEINLLSECRVTPYTEQCTKDFNFTVHTVEKQKPSMRQQSNQAMSQSL